MLEGVLSFPALLTQGLVWGILAMGVYLTFRVLHIVDLTVDGSLCTGGAVCAVLTLAGWNLWLALGAAVVAGLLAGLVTGVLHSFMGLPAVLAGLLTQQALYAIHLQSLGQGLPIPEIPLLTSLHAGSWLAVLPVLALTLGLIAALCWFFSTELGFGIRATGENLAMSRAQGIPTGLSRVLGLMLANALAALAGALLCQFQGAAEADLGRGAFVAGLAALLLGETLLHRYFRAFGLRLLGAVVGAVVCCLGLGGLLRLGLNANACKLLPAVLVALILAASHWKTRHFRRAVKRPVGRGEPHA